MRPVSAAKAEPKTDRPLWPMLALLAFVVLMVEWLYYHRSAGWFAK